MDGRVGVSDSHFCTAMALLWIGGGTIYGREKSRDRSGRVKAYRGWMRGSLYFENKNL